MDEEKQPGRKERILRGLIGQLPPGSFQIRPYISDLLNQPDLLIVPAAGRMVCVFLYGYGQSLTWRLALSALEDLFEIKLHLGHNAVSIALDLSESNETAHREDMRRLLGNTFEAFIHLDFTKSEIADGRFWARVQESLPRQNLFHLWEMEREYVQDSLRRFSKERYRELVDRRRIPTLSDKAIIAQVADTIEEVTGATPEHEPSVESVKGSLGSLSGTYRLGFDLKTRGPIELPIDVIRVGRYGSRDTVRYLMTKARLMRYRAADGRLERQWQETRPLLVVEGNLAGPQHDPFRYVRSLVSVGWEIIGSGAVREFPRMLRDANF